MRVPKGLPRPAVPERLKRKTAPDVKLTEAIQNLPRITNETVAEHREEVLSSARKYIYPLSHSKRRILFITSSLLILAIIVFLTYSTLALYKFRATSSFMYGVTQVIPFPVAKVGSSWVSYESYLFELRHSMHYYQTQQHENFGTKAGKAHLTKLQQDAMNQVIQTAYVKQLASKNHVSVSGQEVNNEVALLRAQNRLGSSDDVFRRVLSEYWGWTENDFKRELKTQLLTQKVTADLNTEAQDRAQDALKQLKSGVDFGDLAKKVSDDQSTRVSGGNYGIAVNRDNRDLPPQVMQELFRLKASQYSAIINTGYALEIDKVLDTNGSTLHAAHIVFGLKPITNYTKPLADKQKPHIYNGVKI